MARGYIGSVGGFADGFTQGFGLINDAYTSKRKLDMAEDELNYTRRKDRLDRDQNQRNFDAEQAAAQARYESEQAAAERRFQAQQTTAQNQYDLDSQQLAAQQESNRITGGINAARAETELLKQKGIADEQARAEADAERARKLDSATAAVAELQIMMNAPTGTYTTEDVMRAVNATEGTAIDIKKYLGADVQAKVAGMTDTIRRGLDSGDLNLNDRAILDGLSSVFDSQRGALIGRTVDASFPNAPEAYKNGNWEVVDRRVVNAKSDPSNSTINADVTVVLRDKNTGDVAYYDAPLTASRDPSGERASVNVADAISGIAGVSMTIQELEKNRPMIENALIRSNFESEREFNSAVEQELQTLKQEKLERPNGRNIVSSKDNESIPDTQLRAIARSRVLGLGQQSPDFFTDRQRVITRARQTLAPALARAFNADGSQMEFTDSQILKIASVMDGEMISPAVRDMIKKMVGPEGIFDDQNPRVNRRGRPIR
jgi:hypothetical protein